MELPILGGSFIGEKYNFIMFGKKNPDLSDSEEVYRLVKYSKDWDKVGSISVNGGQSYTNIPFRSGRVSMAENGDELIVHTARQRYDGHQSNITFKFNTSSMTLTDISAQFPPNHVSHSFSHYVQFDSNDEVYVDLGDAYPRSVLIQKTSNGIDFKELDILKISGEIGDNYTGVTLDAFELGESAYMVIGTSIDQAQYPDENGNYPPKNLIQSNIFVSLIEEDLTSSKTIWLTNHKSGDNKSAKPPYVTKINNNKFMLMWVEDTLDSKGIISKNFKYLTIDSQGNKLSDTKELPNTDLVNITPIYKDGKVLAVITPSVENYYEVIELEN